MSVQADSQQAFGSAIRDPGKSVPCGLINRPDGTAEGRFNIYRNNHVVGLAGALSKTFPVVEQLVGEKFFQSAAIAYVRAHPPTSPVLLLYGDRFADFLAELPGIDGVAYVLDVARLEWSRVFSLNAADVAPIPVQALSDIDPELLGGVRLEMHPSLQLLSSKWPVLTIWRDCQGEVGEKVNLSNPERLTMVRSALDVNSWRLSPAEFAFVHTLYRGGTLGEAAETAISMQQGFNLPEQLALVFQRGTVAGISLNQSSFNRVTK